MNNKKPTKIAHLIPDNRNANIHSEYGSHLLQKSIQENGLGRSIVISSDNQIIAGNGLVEMAGGIGIDNVRTIETDGKEIIAVKRTDIKGNTPAFYKMALADNIVAKHNIVLDADVINAIATDHADIKDWIEPGTGKKAPGKGGGQNLNHDERFSITLTFVNEKDYLAVKDHINKSTHTAEQCILNALNIKT